MERERRSNVGTLRVKVLRRNQERPKQFIKFLRNSENKLDLVRFLLKDWSINQIHAKSLQDKKLFVTREDKAYRISCRRGLVQAVNESELESQQEEADTKMYLCASFAANLG